MQLSVTLDTAQSAVVSAAAARTGLNHEQVILEAIDLLALREEFGPEAYAGLMAGLADDAAGRYADDAEVDAVFRKYGARNP